MTPSEVACMLMGMVLGIVSVAVPMVIGSLLSVSKKPPKQTERKDPADWWKRGEPMSFDSYGEAAQ